MTSPPVPAPAVSFDGPPPLSERAVERFQSPALVIDLDRVRENLRRVVGVLGGDPDRWRPHIKTSKIPEVLAEFLRLGVVQFKCATTREALHLLEVAERNGSPQVDLLVAYPHVGPALERFGVLAARFPRARLSILCEDPEIAARIPEALGIFVDMNPGMNRTGIPLESFDDAVEIARSVGERFRGVHFYEGHVHTGSFAERAHRTTSLYQRLATWIDRFRSAGFPVAELITSGTPTFTHAAASEPLASLEATLHRVSPGTVVYHDARSAELEELDLLPAATILTRVVSRPTGEIFTTDAGSKSIAAEAGSPCAVVVGQRSYHALEPSEEHLPFRCDTGPLPARGAPLWLVPRHVCPTVNLAEEAILLEGGRVHSIVPVRSRAHELLPG